MDILYLLVPLSVVLVFAIGAVFWLALRGGQFDDLEAPAFRILADDDSPQVAKFDPGQIRPPPGSLRSKGADSSGAGSRVHEF